MSFNIQLGAQLEKRLLAIQPPQVFLKVVLEGIADCAVPVLPADQPRECLSEPGSVAWSKTTETQNEMIVVLQLNQGTTNGYLWPSGSQGVS